MKVAALAGGVGAGKFLRGLVRAMPPEKVTVVVNTGDDIEVHGLFVSPDLDSVLYWLAGVMDRERGWGREGETFRTTEELRRLGAEGSWFGLGDLDMTTHLFRTRLLRAGHSLAEATWALAEAFGLRTRLLPMTNDPAPTVIEAVDDSGLPHDLHFQEYWVERGGRDAVKAVRLDAASAARPAYGVLDALSGADLVLLCPSNPIVSMDPILAVPGVRQALRARRETVAGVSPIVGGAPLRGMADRLLPVAGVEVSSLGVAGHYEGLLGGWVIDERDRDLAGPIAGLGLRVEVTDTIMVDDGVAEAVAVVALEAAAGGG
jgi:LPPG:FO 2-phospho-L-lactate transferase